MSDYSKATNFAAKDSLTTGDPNKVVKGTEIDDEFNAIASAIASKADESSPAFTGTPTAPTASSGTNTTQIATTAFVTTAVSTATGSLGNMSTQNKNAVDITGGTIVGITDLAIADGGTGASTAANARTNLGLGSLAVLSSVGTTEITDAAVTPAKLSQPLTLGTAQATTSGTSIDFTSIPSWVKRITVMFNNVSTNGTSRPLIQLGDSGGVENTGYDCNSLLIGVQVVQSTTGFVIFGESASNLITGQIVFSLMNTSNTWVGTGTFFLNSGGTYYTVCNNGVKQLSGTLDRIRLTTVGGTDTFDAGSINIMYE